jgi:hypothetical protein
MWCPTVMAGAGRPSTSLVAQIEMLDNGAADNSFNVRVGMIRVEAMFLS